MTLSEFLTNIANAIRAKLNTTDAIKATDFASEIGNVYETGKINGGQEILDAWWNSLSSNGTRTIWDRGFSRQHIFSELFKPSATIKVTGVSSQMFYYATCDEPIDVQALEEELGYPIFDTSAATRLDYFNQPGVFSTLGVMDFSNCVMSNSLQYMFVTNNTRNYLTSIKKIIVTSDTYFTANMFTSCSNLRHCIFEGTIGTTGLNMSACDSLDKDSITSIFRSLSSTTNGLSVTFSQEAIDKAFASTEDGVDGSTTSDWLTYVASRSNWNIALI